MSNDLAGREWRFYIADMIGSCERVLSFNVAISREEFSTDPMRYDATVCNIELLGVVLHAMLSYTNVPWVL